MSRLDTAKNDIIFSGSMECGGHVLNSTEGVQLTIGLCCSFAVASISLVTTQEIVTNGITI